MNLFAAMSDLYANYYTPEKTFWIAYSGGLDSQVLLALCAEFRDTFPVKLQAIHLNHQLSPHASQWAKHCQLSCQHYGINYTERSLALKLQAGDSIENVARKARYAIFAEYIGETDILLTAHQQDDQAETMLLQLLRGAGPKGLAAMPYAKPFANGLHVRPLLNFSRDMLERYANEYQLQWLDDESNRNTQLTRNFIRHNILPLLQTRWPTVIRTIARSAAHCAEAQQLLVEFTVADLQQAQGTVAGTLSVKKLMVLTPARQRLLLRSWIEQRGFPLPDSKKLTAITHTLLTAADDRQPCVRWNSHIEMRRYADNLYLLTHLSPQHPQQPVVWDFSAPIDLVGMGQLHAVPTIGSGLTADVKQVSVRFRQGGEKISLLHRGRQSLKNLLQEWRVPPWERGRIPLIYYQDECIAVVGHAIATDYIAHGSELGFALKLECYPATSAG